MKELHEFISRIGIWKIIDILKDYIDVNNNSGVFLVWSNSIPYRSFNLRLKVIGNIKMFYRNKDILIEKGIIEITEISNELGKKEKLIRLTSKGVKIYTILVYLKKQVFDKDLRGFTNW